jgi:lipopolysaccharide biosynthesis glycosyltransferase
MLVPGNNGKNIIMTVALGPQVQELLDYTGVLMSKYAHKIGADFFVYKDDQAWEKYQADPTRDNLTRMLIEAKFMATRLLTTGYDRVLYLDADIIVLNTAPNIFEEVPYGQFGIMEESQFNPYAQLSMRLFTEEYNKLTDDPLTNYHSTYYNSGVMVFDRQSKTFPLPLEYFGAYHQDQDYINWALKKYEIHIYPLPQKFNMFAQHFTFDQLAKEAAFIHFCGSWSHEERLIYLDSFIEELMNRGLC